MLLNFFKSFRIVFSILIISIGFWGQTYAITIEGKIFDKDSHEPVPYVNIVDINLSIGTSSNSKGEFSFSVDKLPLKLVFTHLTYNSDTIVIQEYSTELKITLTPSLQTLPEIQISPGSYARYIIDRAANKINDKRNTVYYGQAFYRMFTFIKDKPHECQEMVFDVKMNNFKVNGRSLVQGRYAAEKGGMDFTRFSLYTFYFSMLSGNDKEGYYFNADSAIRTDVVEILKKDNGQKIAKVKMYSAKSTTEIILYIDIENFNLVRFYGTSYEQNVNPPPLHKLKKQKNTWDISFKTINDSSICLDYIDVEMIAEIGFKFQTFEMVNHSHTFFYNTKTTSSETINYNYNPMIADRKAIENVICNADFWKNNPVFKRTVEEDRIIESFEKKRSFGKILE